MTSQKIGIRSQTFASRERYKGMENEISLQSLLNYLLIDAAESNRGTFSTCAAIYTNPNFFQQDFASNTLLFSVKF